MDKGEIRMKLMVLDGNSLVNRAFTAWENQL